MLNDEDFPVPLERVSDELFFHGCMLFEGKHYLRSEWSPSSIPNVGHDDLSGHDPVKKQVFLEVKETEFSAKPPKRKPLGSFI
jgi:hypothetical protein